MRTDHEFIDQYRAALAGIDPATKSFDRGDLRELALTELSLRFISKFLPEDTTDAVPSLVAGYGALLGPRQGPEALMALIALRHLAYHFGSLSLWTDACRSYCSRPETIRCFDLVDGRAQLRRACPERLLDILDAHLSTAVPWTKNKQKPAPPGEAIVEVSGGDVLLSYRIPALSDTTAEVKQHQLKPRSENQPISFSLAELSAVAAEVDAREAAKDWCRQMLLPLELSKRLRAVRIMAPGKPGEVDTLTLSGATHVVGMLSSGKSTIATAILFAATLRARRRVAVFALDTVSAALLAERLRRHGVSATVLASFRRRTEHLKALERRGPGGAGGTSLSGFGFGVHGFGTACPLDGFQDELVVLSGSVEKARWPTWDEKPCRKIRLGRGSATSNSRGVPADGISEGDSNERRSSFYLCPLFPACPAHEQQRAATEAQVLIITPAAFAYVTPEPWVLRERMSIAELLQFAADLVIIDEVDLVQTELDRIFAPDEPIMDSLPGAYLTEVAARSAEAVRLRSGGQFRHRTAIIWQNNFYSFSRLVVLACGLLQNEREFLSGIFRRGPFTAARILCDLYSERCLGIGATEDSDALVEVLRIVSTISRSASLSVSGEERKDAGWLATEYARPDIGAAAEALGAIALRVLVADDYAPIASQVEEMLQGSLAPFDARASERYATARKVLLAVISELILSYYGWLTMAQPTIETEFGIEGVEFFRKAPLVRNYRTLLPGNPTRTVLGLIWDEPEADLANERGGRLRLISHLGAGRHLVVHLHDLLRAEGQAGPHVLALSGTSWAGGRRQRTNSPDQASPSFDVQIPVTYVLRQPDEEINAISMSRFELVEVRTAEGKQARLSGTPPRKRPEVLRLVADFLTRTSEGKNLIERHWDESERQWNEEELRDRRRALLVVNSYSDAATVSNALVRSVRRDPGAQYWRVFCLRRDGDEEDDETPREKLDADIVPLARSAVESFGRESERSILVAPIGAVSRGYNILNGNGKAAISSIYLLHRPHPRPGDLRPFIARLNRLAIDAFDATIFEPVGSVADAALRVRQAAMSILRESLGRSQRYSILSDEYKAQFAWDLLTQLWQAIGRGIRGGTPVFVGFVDAAFADHSFEGQTDTPANSALVQAIRQLELAMCSPEPRSNEIATRLYQPFLAALKRTRRLDYECGGIA
jgi:hypothetical protein